MNEFEKFIDLLEIKNPYPNQPSTSNYIYLLNDLKSNGPACIYLYEKLISLGKPLKKNDYLDNILFQAISNCDDETFNKHFISIADSIDISAIRNVFLNRPDNKLLKDYIESKDTPKKIDQVISILTEYYLKDKTENKKYFYEEVSKYKMFLSKLNTITKHNSRAKTNFLELLSYMMKFKGIEGIYSFCKDLNIDISNVITAGKVKLDLPKIMNQNDFKVLKEIFNDYPQIPAHTILNKMFHTPNIVDILLNEKINIEEKAFFWTVLKEEIREIVQNNIYIKSQKAEESESDFLVRSLFSIFTDDKLSQRIRIYHSYMYRNKEDKIKSVIMIINLNEELEEKKSTNKMKI